MISAIIRVLSVGQSRGLIIALMVMMSWLIHLVVLLSLNFATTPWMLLIGSILLQTFLDTGLFITAHDAIHGLVYPPNHRINTGLGMLCAIAYAGLPYRKLAQNHWQHHQFPASAHDPDFHFRDSRMLESASFFRWYQHFMGQYLSGQQFTLMAIALFIGLGWGISPFNLLLLWGFPLLLSSLQLFYFGTYQPHRNLTLGKNRNRVNPSQPSPWLVSFVSCYHFGYHHEHHHHPEVPWWGLPTLYQRNNNSDCFPPANEDGSTENKRIL
jgi:beta-carotene/zeaxanthin 4-ketolase